MIPNDDEGPRTTALTGDDRLSKGSYQTKAIDGLVDDTWTTS